MYFIFHDFSFAAVIFVLGLMSIAFTEYIRK